LSLNLSLFSSKCLVRGIIFGYITRDDITELPQLIIKIFKALFMPYCWVYIGEVDLFEKELEFLIFSQNPEACFFIGIPFSLISLSTLMMDFILHI
jgi:hypothetical protein